MIRLRDFRMGLVHNHKHEGLTPKNCGSSLDLWVGGNGRPQPQLLHG